MQRLAAPCLSVALILVFPRHSFNAITLRGRKLVHNYARAYTPCAHICTRIYVQIYGRSCTRTMDAGVSACCDAHGSS